MIVIQTGLMVSCEKYVPETDGDNGNIDQPANKLSEVTVRVRSSHPDASSSTVYAFADNGKCLANAGPVEAQQTVSLLLPASQHSRIVALAAAEQDFSIPANISYSSAIQYKLQDINYSTTPLQMGFADVKPTDNKLNASVQMYDRQAAVNIKLSGLPHDCVNVNVCISNVSSHILIDGTAQGQVIADISCQKTAEGWESGTVYLLPSTAQQTVFTISYTDGKGAHYASVTYLAPLVAATPYNICGAYEDGEICISGNISMPGWRDPVVIDFNFGNDTETVVGGEEPDEPSDEYYLVDQFPEACSVWNGHIVVAAHYTYGDPDEMMVLLMSLDDWDGVVSAYNEDNPDAAQQIADTYSEYDLTGWDIPTAGNASLLNEAFMDGALYEAILAAGGSPVVTSEGASNVRYLCDEANKTYSFYNNTISKAGAKTTYHLRLTKVITMKKK